MYCNHSPRNRDLAIRWASSFCVTAMHSIRSEHDYNPDELAGFLSRGQVSKMQDANHAPLYAASMIRHYLRQSFKIDSNISPQLAHAYAIQMNTLEQYVSQLIEQVSGMEKIRSTPLPIAYVSHLRTFLFAYCVLLPYVYVKDWEWATVPLVAFTAFALFGIEGSSSEVEIPFERSRPNHLALDGYCLVILDSVQGLVVHDANMKSQQDCNIYDGGGYEDYYEDEDENDTEEDGTIEA
jgi:putative membrane protein